MTTRDPNLPQSSVPGLIPTLNNTGWMTETLDDHSRAFTEYAGTIGDECLDIGCAYGVATLPALANGARVLACDLEPRHLDILANRVPPGDRDRFRKQPGAMPDVDFPHASFGAILCARALHFLRGRDIETTVRKMHDWLLPDGRIFLVADSPYVGPWWKLAPEYERRKREGCPWPGFVQDYAALLPPGSDPAEHPAFIHPLDPDILSRVAAEAGFEILAAGFLGKGGGTGREHAGVIARKTGR
ncbi:MAG: class I SAM-dependent methyltransferase [Gammaproteobacteria bacterium]|nr:class I SAM-dependent methyltransferase [Gammaproteobacteria bacterium]